MCFQENMPVTHAGLFHVIYLLLDGKFQSLTVAEFITVTSNVVPSDFRTEMRMALPISRLIRVSTSAKVGFLGKSESIGSSSKVVSNEFNLAFFTLLLLYSSMFVLPSFPKQPTF
uniref:Uncharacterized protein n=1 Tax=Glycine max TaxID=3847 RepID=C6TD31_SOYBN|nr:unknown [Glycine max]